jgi:hypothetical protein
VATARKPLSRTASRADRTRMQVRFAQPAVMEHCVTRQDRITRPFGESGLSYVASASIDSSATKWIVWLLPNARRILIVLLILQALKRGRM